MPNLKLTGDDGEDVESQLTEDEEIPSAGKNDRHAIESIQRELQRMTNKEFVWQKCKLIKQFAQDKAFFVMQFARTDEKIKVKSPIQVKACIDVGLNDVPLAEYIWKMGGMKSFKNGLAMKRKITMCSVQNAVKASKLKDVCVALIFSIFLLLIK